MVALHGHLHLHTTMVKSLVSQAHGFNSHHFTHRHITWVQSLCSWGHNFIATRWKEIELLKFHAKSACWKENHKIKHTNLNQTSLFVFSEESSIPWHMNLWHSPMPSGSQGFSLSLFLATNSVLITIPGFQNPKWLRWVNLKYVVHGWESALHNLLNSCSLPSPVYLD